MVKNTSENMAVSQEGFRAEKLKGKERRWHKAISEGTSSPQRDNAEGAGAPSHCIPAQS